MLRVLPSFMYHGVSRQSGRMHVSPELLDAQCRVLARKGWRGISLAEAEDCLLRGKSLPRKACLFTFDDGYLDNYVYAEPILRRHGHCGVIFPTLNCLERRENPLPNSEDLVREPGRAAELGDLNAPHAVLRGGFRVRGIRFCSWSEIRRMRDGGAMAAAPHSLNHGRVVSGLAFSRLRDFERGPGFFGLPPYEAPWGMPLFAAGYSLSTRGYNLNPDLFDLLRKQVPQKAKAAKAFLAETENREALLEAIKKLPWLGRLETQEEFRARLFAEFTACRRIFAEETGEEPLSFCWPWGSFCRESVEEAERAGFRLFFCASWTKGAYRLGRPVRRVAVRRYTLPQKLPLQASVFSFAPFGAAYAYLAKLRRLLRGWRLSSKG